MTLTEISLTTEDYGMGTVVASLMAVVIVFLLAWRVEPSQFGQRGWAVAGASAIFWSIFSTAMLWILWDVYYRHIFSGWARWLAPLNALLYGAIGFVLWWLALRLPGNAIVNFCLLGGLESLPEHLWGIYGLGILDQVPVLEEASPVSILVFAVPEYVVYWGVVLGLAVLLRRGWQRRMDSHQGTET